MAEHNCWLIAEGYGTRTCYATVITHGVSIIADEHAARTHRTLHPWKRTSGSFDVTVAHSGPRDYEVFNEWLKVYIERIINPENTTVGPMRVWCPARDFDKVAIPSGGIEWNRTPRNFAPTQTLGFKGASDPVDLESNDLTIVSAAYQSTYYEPGGSPGDYLSSYAIGLLGDALLENKGDGTYDKPIGTNPFFGGGGSGGTSGSGVR